MNTPAPILTVLIVCLTTILSACGGDDTSTGKSPPKAATTQPTTPPESTPPKKPAPPQPAPTNEPTPTTPGTQAAPVQALSISEGKKLYDTTCKVCHDQGLLDSPKLTDKAGWAKRLERGVDTLHQHSAKGFGKMPAQATGDVSEAQVYAAVDYMLEQVR